VAVARTARRGRAGRRRERRGGRVAAADRRRSLEELVAGAIGEMDGGGVAGCPVCGERSLHAGGCEACGSELG